MALVRQIKKERRDPREAAFYEAFFGQFANEGRGDATKAAIQAGYDESKAAAIGRKLESQLEKKPMLESLRHAGITKPRIVLFLQTMMEQARTSTSMSEIRQTVKLLLEVMGELNEGGAPTTIVNAGQGAQILVVAGKTDERMKRLKAGATALSSGEQSGQSN